MKIRNKFIIPVIAIFVALLMTGAPVATVAADTVASDETSETTTTNPAWTHDYTYVPETLPPTSSLEEEIENAVSNIIGDKGEGVGDTIRDTASVSGKLLRAIRDFIDKLIAFTKSIGDFFAGGGIGGLFNTTATQPSTEETVTTTAAQ